jgi:hypothetical protein
MNRISWSLVNNLSRALERDERAAVLGDFAESHESCWKALRGLLGLVIRRQAALWNDWRPWLALAGVAGIIGPRLSRMSGALLFPIYMDVRTYWQHGVLYGTGLSTHEEATVFFCQGLAVVVWSWTGGFVLGSLSRRTAWVTGPLYLLFGLYPLLLLVPSLVLFPLRILLVSTDYRNELFFLPFVLLTIFQAALFVLPSISGMRQGLRKLTLTLPRTGALAITTLGLIAAATWTGGWQRAAMVRWSGGTWDPSIGWQNRLFAFSMVSWPVAYLLTLAIARRFTKAAHTTRSA